MIDATSQLNAVHRTVGTRSFQAGELRTVTLTQTYPSGIEDVWDACTSAARIPRWFLPVSGDLRLGGRFQLQGNAGGTVEACDPPNCFRATWEAGEQLSWIELRLTAESDERTRFELQHLLPADAKWDEFGPGAVGVGWDLGLLGLATHLTTGASADPEEGVTWLMSDEGRACVRASTAGWREADIAGGADADQARAAADRTSAAYGAG